MPDDYVPRNGYQDELDTEATDPLMNEQEDLAAELDMPPEELAERLNDLDPDVNDVDGTVEDLDEDQGDDTKY